MESGFTYAPAYDKSRGLPSPRLIYPPASLHCLRSLGGSDRENRLTQFSIPLATLLRHGRSHGGAGISTCCASTTPLGLALAPDLPTLGGLALPRNPWISGGGVSHPSFATHANILTRPRSTESYPSASVHDRRSATTYTSCINPQLRLCT